MLVKSYIYIYIYIYNPGDIYIYIYIYICVCLQPVLSWQNNPFSDFAFLWCRRIHKIWDHNPFSDSPKETHPNC